MTNFEDVPFFEYKDYSKFTAWLLLILPEVTIAKVGAKNSDPPIHGILHSLAKSLLTLLTETYYQVAYLSFSVVRLFFK